ncbi:MAG: restriction endonuclease subunit M [Thiotrichaceae bacterium]|nr:MAG: restriction endonuclease subunit M [Thiotrichaceae bacterium]
MIKPVIPWMGGKGRLADKILPLFPDHTCYVEVFAGAAALYFRKEPSKCEVLNDVNGELINMYRVIQHHLEEFIKQLKWAISSRTMFEWEKAKNIDTLTDIQRAARFYYLHKTCFGGRGQNYGTATTSPARFRILHIEEDLVDAHYRLSGVNVEQLDWRECIKRYDRPHTFFYLDPPYWGTAGYGVEFSIDEYTAMAELARTIKGKLMISVNDHKDMRKVFDGLKTKKLPITYSVSRCNKSKKSYELIIKSW